jgi:hypothetical protein
MLREAAAAASNEPPRENLERKNMNKRSKLVRSNGIRTTGPLSLLFGILASAGFQACMQDASDDAGKTPAVFPEALYAAQENSLVSFDLATGRELPGRITEVKSPTDMQALEDGTLLLNLSASNEILAVDGKTMLLKARVPSSGGTAVKPVQSFITPDLDGKRYWVSLNDGSGASATNSARFLSLDPDSSKFLKPAGEIGLGVGHHKAAFSPDRPRVVISNIGDCGDIMSVFDFSDPGNITRVAKLDAQGAGFDGSDIGHTCDPSKSAGIAPSPHGCAAAKANAHALCNMTGTGVLAAVDLDAAAPAFTLIPTSGAGAGYTAAHPGGRYI